MKQQTFKAIIFDCDGVLVDSEPIALQTLVDLVGQLGYRLSAEYVDAHFTGSSMEQVLAGTEAYIGHKLPPDFEPGFRDETFRRFAEALRPIPGIVELVGQLSIPFCTASNGPREKIEHNLKVVGLLDRFEGRIFSAYEVKSWKPDPELFLHAAAAMGQAPEDCLVVEDSVPGLRAARAGGFRVMGYAPHPHARARLQGEGAEVFETMEALAAILGIGPGKP